MRRRLRPRTRQSSPRSASPGGSPATALLSDAEDADREDEATQREKDAESEEEIAKEEEGGEEEEEISLWRCFVGELTLSERAAEERRMERLVDNMPGFVRVLVYVEKVRERETE